MVELVVLEVVVVLGTVLTVSLFPLLTSRLALTMMGALGWEISSILIGRAPA